jgi:hypothetical protein
MFVLDAFQRCVNLVLGYRFQPEGATPPPMPGKNVLSFDNIADLEASNVPMEIVGDYG